MINRIKKWLRLCEHEWEQIHKSDVYDPDHIKYPIGHKWVYQCKKCKNLKMVKDY